MSKSQTSLKNVWIHIAITVICQDYSKIVIKLCYYKKKNFILKIFLTIYSFLLIKLKNVSYLLID